MRYFPQICAFGLMAISALIGSLVTTPVYSAEKYGAAGCGLGSIVIGPKKGMIQIFAATTNGTSGSQTFGITTGTSNCHTPKESAALKEQQHFVATNISALEKDIARGDGETLRAFSATLGCQDQAFADVARTLNSSYAKIFAAPGANAVLTISKQQIKADANIAGKCHLLI